jgi:transcriptional regulator GlxA family with amidase domain
MKIVILLYKGFTALDAIGPYEVLSRLPDTEVKFAAKEKGLVQSENASMKMMATHSLAEIDHTDILLVPGSTTAFLDVVKDGEIISHIQQIDAMTQWTTSVCTGGIILAAAGLLKGKKATTHWAALQLLSQFGATPVSERFVQQGKMITAAGVSAGIDMALHLVKKIAGDSYAKMVQLLIEYYPEPPVEVFNLSRAPKEVENAARAFFREEMKKVNKDAVVVS